MLTCSSYLTCSNQAYLHSEIYLSSRVETLLNRIYSKHNHPQIKAETRRRLSSVSQELASETLRKVFNASCVKGTLDGFINYLRGQAVSSVYGSPRPCSGVSPPPALSLPELLGKKVVMTMTIVAEMSLLDSEVPSPKSLKLEVNGGSELLALGERDFKKAFLLLTYIPGEAGQISGDVLVYRNPGLHFGDIHVLKATYVKALEEHVGNSKYGVFFPQIGPRSLGDEIAGGDFDGDMYFISRNPNGTTNYSPLEPWVSSSPPSRIYAGTAPSELTPEMLEEKLFRMFLEARFNSSNVVGAAADSWLTIMDRYLTLGDERAKEKAGMKRQILKAIDIYYDALDAPKNGAKKSRNYRVLKMSWSLSLTWRNGEADENNKKELASEVIKKYKQEFYGGAEFKDIKRNLDAFYPQALALYNIVYDYAILKNNVRYCGFVWRVAGRVLWDFYFEKKVDGDGEGEESFSAAGYVVKKLYG
ncbi:hypothetical protein Bca52824_057128 [Brassica carinata]|nr:hypothetical protein Bca52824_057128 [Brassica carinata]